MFFNIIIILVFLGVAYFHYAQGLLAATISLVCAAVAAFMAFSYHETIVVALTGGRLAAYANGAMLCLLFALIYSVLRFFTDNLVPGNARYPVALDKGGAAVVGLLAAIFPAAILAIAAQQLPFGPTVAGYSPLPTADAEMVVPNHLSRQFRVERGDGAPIFGQLQVDRLGDDDADEQRQGLWIPVDDWFLAMVAKLSDEGSLAGANELQTVYPDFKTAAFASRLGIQRAATQAALNVAGQEQVTVKAVFAPTPGDAPPAADDAVTDDAEAQDEAGETADAAEVAEASPQFPAEGIPQVDGDLRDGQRNLPANYLPPAGKRILVVRVGFDRDMSDRGGLVRFGPASARLVSGGNQYFPIGTLESATILVNNKVDDYLLASDGADLVYEVDPSVVVGESLAQGTFLEFKRFGRVDLGGRPVRPRVTKDASTHVLRKVTLIGAISERLAGGEDRENNAFDALRASVPAAAEDDAETPADDATTTGGGGPMDTIRGAREEQERALQGN